MTPPARFGDKLSRREAQVAIEILFGHTRPQQARNLNISIRTLDCYHTRLFRKYGVHNCFGLVRAMMRSA
jgi:DNA-binding CsgD family transcriptional regulator